jgi:iron complex transport system permease protein
MNTKKQNTILFQILIAVFCLFIFVNISIGSISIPIKEVLSSIVNGHSSKETWYYIVTNYRLPKAITAILVGIALSISGLLMQTLFRNPLAGPYVLGLSSGSSLAVAFVVLGSGFLPSSMAPLFRSEYGIVLASTLGSTVVLVLILAVSQRLRDTMALLIIGLMFGSFTSAMVSVLTYFSTAEQLQKFTFWSLGNLGSMTWTGIIILLICTAVGLILSFSSIKSLDALLLGENYAVSLGVNYKKTKLILLLATSLLAGSCTAFVGPIAFVGLAIPHIAKMIFKTSNHTILFWSTLILGATIMLVCDTISELGPSPLPINAVTSLFGAPVVIALLLKKRAL